MWWQDAVVYQVYPRSLQDSNGDGVGDLRGIISRLDHIRGLGVDAIWLSPIFASPLADFGYDVSDYRSIDPRLGTMADFDELLAGAHERGLRLLLDVIPCHTSIEHPWFREHPDFYVWADEPPNNWTAAFGGSAWSKDPVTGRCYLHSFYPEQPDLDWHNPQVVAAMQEVIRFWADRGVDGFRLDALQRLSKDAALRDDPPAQGEFPLPLGAEFARLEHRYSENDADVGSALAALRQAAGPDLLLIGEVYLPTAELAPYLEHLDVAFCFEFLFAALEPQRLREVIRAAIAMGSAGWVLSNHDVSRLASRVGPERVRVASMLLLTLPGMAFVYQGDEIGMCNGPAPAHPLDRAGRDVARTPMQWTADARGDFTSGESWLPMADPSLCNVNDQESDPHSVLWLYRRLIELRRAFGPGLRFLESADTVIAYERGEHLVALNLGTQPAPAPPAGEVLLGTTGAVRNADEIAPLSGWVARRRV